MAFKLEKYHARTTHSHATRGHSTARLTRPSDVREDGADDGKLRGEAPQQRREARRGIILHTFQSSMYISAPSRCTWFWRGRPVGRLHRQVPELKGSIGEGSNHSNFSDQSSVKILSE